MLLCCFQRNVHDAAQQVGWSVANTRKCQREDTSHRLRPVKAFARDKECLLFGHSLLVVVVAQIFQQPVLVEWEDLRGSLFFSTGGGALEIQEVGYGSGTNLSPA